MDGENGVRGLDKWLVNIKVSTYVVTYCVYVELYHLLDIWHMKA